MVLFMFHLMIGFFEDHMIKTALKGISQLHYFQFTATHPGTVFIKTSSDGIEHSIQLLKDPTWKPTATHLPRHDS